MSHEIRYRQRAQERRAGVATRGTPDSGTDMENGTSRLVPFLLRVYYTFKQGILQRKPGARGYQTWQLGAWYLVPGSHLPVGTFSVAAIFSAPEHPAYQTDRALCPRENGPRAKRLPRRSRDWMPCAKSRCAHPFRRISPCGPRRYRRREP